MTFSKRSNTKKDNFTIDTKNIANTKVFKYLGITINCKNCTFTQTLTDLSIKASKGIIIFQDSNKIGTSKNHAESIRYLHHPYSDIWK